MKISNHYVREGTQYKKADLFNQFDLSWETGERLLSLLLQYGVMQPLRQCGPEMLFKFSFVGIIYFDNLVIRCYPKYIHSCPAPENAFAQVMAVIRRYGRKSDSEYNPVGNNSHLAFSLISEAVALLEDYAEHGLYISFVPDSEYNGSGEILWDRTIGSMEAFYGENGPIYNVFHTRKIVDEAANFVTRIHKLILTECSRLLEKANLLAIFGLTTVWLSDERREYCGSNEYILQRLNAERASQYDDRKQNLLTRLIRFIERSATCIDEPLQLYGTTSFERVWEAVCARAFGNQLDLALGQLPLSCDLEAAYKEVSTLKALINKPQWNLEGWAPFFGNGTLIPDIAVLYRFKEEDIFVILDAKYYCYSHLADQLPGVTDIYKQYLYELAFKPFLETHGIKFTQNVFLLPTEGKKIQYKGYVEFAVLKNLGCQNIKIILVPAEKAFSCYLGADIKEEFMQNALNALYK